jgi:hypothetical protein
MDAIYKRHGFPATKASKVMQEPDESQEPEIGAVVPVEGGCALNKSYTISDSEEDEGEGGAVAAVGGAEPAEAPAAAAAAAAAAPEPAAATIAGPAWLVCLIGVLCTAIKHCNAKLESCLNASAKYSQPDP